MKARITSKGQVTVPKVCRDKLGLRTGTILDFETVDGVLVARKVQHEDIFAKWRGKGQLPGQQSVDDYLGSIRE